MRGDGVSWLHQVALDSSQTAAREMPQSRKSNRLRAIFVCFCPAVLFMVGLAFAATWRCRVPKVSWTLTGSLLRLWNKC